MTRRLAITRRVDLGDLADGWSDCYAIVTTCSYQEFEKMTKFQTAKTTNIELLRYGIDLAKKHVVGGKVRVLNVDGSSELVDMDPDDLEDDRDLADRIIGVVTGVIPDPKVLSTSTETSSTSEPSTEQ